MDCRSLVGIWRHEAMNRPMWAWLLEPRCFNFIVYGGYGIFPECLLMMKNLAIALQSSFRVSGLLLLLLLI